MPRTSTMSAITATRSWSSDIGYAVAAGSAIAATVVFFTGQPSAEPAPLTAAVGRDAVSVSWRTRL